MKYPEIKCIVLYFCQITLCSILCGILKQNCFNKARFLGFSSKSNISGTITVQGFFMKAAANRLQRAPHAAIQQTVFSSSTHWIYSFIIQI